MTSWQRRQWNSGPFSILDLSIIAERAKSNSPAAAFGLRLLPGLLRLGGCILYLKRGHNIRGFEETHEGTDHDHLVDGTVRIDRLLDHLRVDVEAAGNDQVLLAVDEVEIAVVVAIADGRGLHAHDRHGRNCGQALPFVFIIHMPSDDMHLLGIGAFIFLGWFCL